MSFEDFNEQIDPYEFQPEGDAAAEAYDEAEEAYWIAMQAEEAAAEREAEMAYERHLEDAGSRLDPEGYAHDAAMEANDPQLNGSWMELEAEAQMAQYDDDPNPYHGDYPDDTDLPF